MGLRCSADRLISGCSGYLVLRLFPFACLRLSQTASSDIDQVSHNQQWLTPEGSVEYRLRLFFQPPFGYPGCLVWNSQALWSYAFVLSGVEQWEGGPFSVCFDVLLECLSYT